jgi:hypothetical protein
MPPPAEAAVVAVDGGDALHLSGEVVAGQRIIFVEDGVVMDADEAHEAGVALGEGRREFAADVDQRDASEPDQRACVVRRGALVDRVQAYGGMHQYFTRFCSKIDGASAV